MTDALLAALLMDHPFADDEGLLFTVNRSMTAGEARAAARARADELTALGVEPGSAVAVALPNGPEVITTMTAVWLAGGVFVPVNPRSPEAELARVLDATDPAAIVRADGVTSRDAQRSYDPGVAFVMWTSGTTGAPKAILHTHAAYLELLDRVLGPLQGGGGGAGGGDAGRRSDRTPSPNLIPVSLALNAGIYNVLFGLRAGAPLVIMDSFEPKEFAELVRRFEIRSTVLPPARDGDAVRRSRRHRPRATALRAQHHRAALTAPGRTVHPQVRRVGAQQLRAGGDRRGGRLDRGRCQGAPGEGRRDRAPARRASTSGSSTTTGRRSVPTRSDYCSCARRAWPRGTRPARNSRDRVDADGYVDTGDLARIDADGFVWIEGRAGDLINRGGNKVFPEQVEEVLCLAPGVSEAAVVGVPDERLGEVPVAFVVGAATDDELDRALPRAPRAVQGSGRVRTSRPAPPH